MTAVYCQVLEDISERFKYSPPWNIGTVQLLAHTAWDLKMAGQA